MMRLLLVFALCIHGAAAADIQFKEGWSREQVDALSAGCSQAIIEPAKRDYAAAAKRAGNKSPKPFPEAQMLASINPMCGCIAERAADTWTFREFRNNQATQTSMLINEAMSGGRCKPEGALGDAMARKKRKRP